MNELYNTESALEKVGFVIHTIKGTSMMPLLDQNKDAVHLVPIKDEPKVNDIVLFRRENGALVLHRIIKIKDSIFIIRGDNCISSENVERRQIIARADAVYKDGKYIPCDDKKLLQYAKKLPRRWFFRYVRALPCAVFARIFKKEKKSVKSEVRTVPEEFRFLIKLIAAALSENKVTEYPQDISFRRLFDIAKAQSVAATVFPALDKDKVPAEIYAEFEKHYNANLRREILFDAEREAILSEMEMAGIAYLPLKGIILKNFYPKRGMREFSDNDILCDGEKSHEIAQIMKSRGFEAAPSDGVAYSFHKKPIYNFEMHRELFDRDFPAYKGFESIMERAVHDSGNFGYRMTYEDFYVYQAAHFYKHYFMGGTGIRSFADFMLTEKYVAEKSGFDKEYAENLISKCSLSDFLSAVKKATHSLFSRADADDELLLYIYSSGTYGSLENYVKNGVKEKGRFRYALSRIFMPYRFMKLRFPLLSKLPFLLPFFWIARFFIFIFSGKYRKATLDAIKKSK